jgi:hypothetical protein
MKLALFLLGCVAWSALVRWWQPRIRIGILASYSLVSLLYLAPSLLTGGTQVASDQIFRWRPWSETVTEKVVPSNPLLADPVLQMLPFRTLVRERLLAGEAPLWSHELGTGQPLLGNAQSAPLAPFHLAALPVEPLDAMAVAAAWQLFAALALTHVLMLILGVRGWGAALAAITFGLSCFSIVWLFYPLGMTAVWLPGLLAATVLMARGERGGVAGFVVCAVAMAASGHPETMAHSALVIAVVGGWLGLRTPGAARWRYGRRLVTAVLLSALLAVPILGPVVEALPDSQRLAELGDAPAASSPSFEPRMLVPLVSPFHFGSPRHGNWSGPWNFNELVPVYAGLVPLLLAVFGGFWLRGRVAAVLAGGAAALVAALGIDPLLGMVQALPLLEHGAHGRLRFVWTLAVAVAAGSTLDAMLRRELSVRSRAAFAAVALLGAALAVTWAPGSHPWERAWWLTTLFGVVACVGLLVVPGRSRLAGFFVVVAVFGDLLVLGVRYNPALPRELRPNTPPALTAMIGAVGNEPYRVAAEEWDFPPNLPALYGLSDPRGNDPMRPAGPATFVRRQLEGTSQSQAWTRLRPGRFDFAALDFLAVRNLLTPHRRHMPSPWLLIAEDQGGKVWMNPAAKPLFFVAKGAGELASIERTSNGLRLELNATSPVSIDSSVSYAPQWEVKVDGRASIALKTEDSFLRLVVPSGAQEIELRYRPWSWRWGGWILPLALLAAAAGPFVRRMQFHPGRRSRS